MASTDHSISVVGQCKLDVQPDKIQLQFTVEEENKNQKVVSENAHQKYNTLLSKMKAANIKNAEFETNQYQVYPNYAWEDRKRVFKGYKAIIGLTIKTSDLEVSGKLFQIGNDLNISNIQGPNPYISDELSTQMNAKCLKIATSDAQKKASILAESLGVKLGPAISISEQSSLEPQPPTYTIKSAMLRNESMESTSPDISIGKQTYKVTIAVNFQIK